MVIWLCTNRLFLLVKFRGGIRVGHVYEEENFTYCQMYPSYVVYIENKGLQKSLNSYYFPI